ncbi:hypothetical protein LguiA_019756 [Lonicera macranthoides]
MTTSTVAGSVSAANISPFLRRQMLRPTTRRLNPIWKISLSASLTSRQSVVSTEHQPSTNASPVNGSFVKHCDGSKEDLPEKDQSSLKEYFKQSRDFIIQSDGGPPRWFSPLECGSRLNNSPLLLYLPGIDGTGLGLTLQHQRLGGIFDIWCLNIPVMDRTPFSELVKLVERTVRSEHFNSPKRPIYLVGDSLGGCLALAVAACNPDIDLILILANPATCFAKSQLYTLMPLLHIMPQQLPLGLPFLLSLMTDIPSRMAMATVEKGLPLQQTVGELSQSVAVLSSYISGLVDALPVETLLWKLKMLESASAYANSRLHAVKAQSLILTSGKDQLLPSQEEGERLRSMLPKCEIRTFNDSAHSLLLEDGLDLVTIIKGASYYRRGRHLDYVSDYLPPIPSEVKKVVESYSWLNVATSPVMLSTLENGEIVRSLQGIPSEGPVVFVGYHMMLGFELGPLVTSILIERNILVRGVAHPMMFKKLVEGKMPSLSNFDSYRLMGAVPVSATNFFRLISSKSHVLLYPGGVREALHRKGEEYKLFWPEQSEFVRMAARFGAKIVPFGVVGEDDVGELVFDYDDQMKIPFIKDFINDLTKESVKLRLDSKGEVANQDVHLPIVLPKLPGRFYYYFGKPIETAGREVELKRREKAHELYLEVKSEVEKCLCYLKEKREMDPYRSILARAAYLATHGLESQVPTFEL